MLWRNILNLIKNLEDPKYPLLGPTLWGLHCFGLWDTGSKWTIVYRFIHLFKFIIVLTQFADLYFVRHDINKVTYGISLTGVTLICLAKSFSCVMYQVKWNLLYCAVSEIEIGQKRKGDSLTRKHMDKYIKYSRNVTYMYWFMVLVTLFVMVLVPFLRLMSPNYRRKIILGQESWPQIATSWFPFDSSKMPGYLVAVIVHIFMLSETGVSLAAFDMNVVAIMTYLKGQLIILRAKYQELFEDVASGHDVEHRIKVYHKHHNDLLKHYGMLNDLLSPIMFLYVLICSITICATVIQFNSEQATTSQKIWVIEYSCSLVVQLFMYCWHSNEITVESIKLDRGIYNSSWWRGNVKERKLVLLSGGKLNHTFILFAGPFTPLTVATFISILKGAYSFYTLLYQMREQN